MHNKKNQMTKIISEIFQDSAFSNQHSQIKIDSTVFLVSLSFDYTKSYLEKPITEYSLMSTFHIDEFCCTLILNFTMWNRWQPTSILFYTLNSLFEKDKCKCQFYQNYTKMKHNNKNFILQLKNNDRKYKMLSKGIHT